ncbi:MAG: hypothetical protein L6422_11370, partial [Candidatus Marinimicrobia bacterium]|nr:hypothetical protein [Candidatus Neomarinimicrobiota bacterium]
CPAAAGRRQVIGVRRGAPTRRGPWWERILSVKSAKSKEHSATTEEHSAKSKEYSTETKEYISKAQE